ncbi:MAG: hypothetical protein JXR75_11320 [Rhodobacteraceae bacterium]|nr:hypothetical protein [Paracoccaceae bacterium]
MTKARLLMVAMLPLYLGPLLAGLSAMGWSAVPVFIAVFALWLVVMRPATWPRDLTLWNMEKAVAAAAQVAVNAVIVVVLFAVGRGLGGVAGFVPQIPPFVPVAVSFLAVPLSRLVWDPIKADALDRFLDDAILQVDKPGHRPSPMTEDPMVKTLLDLPGDCDPVLTADALSAALQGPQASLRLSALADALDFQDLPRLGLREGLILWATDPGRTPDRSIARTQATAFTLAGSDPDLLRLFATRAVPLLRADPDLRHAFPDAASVAATIDDTLPIAVREGLQDLVAALKEVSPPEEWPQTGL